MSPELPCQGYAEEWSAYLDGELAPVRRAELAAHLEGCEVCGARVEALRAADAALRADLALGDVPGDLRDRLQARIEEDRVVSLAAARRRRVVAPLAGLLAAAAALALYLAVTRDTPIAPAPTPRRVASEEPEVPAPAPETLPEVPPLEEPPTLVAVEPTPETPGTAPDPPALPLDPPAPPADGLLADASEEELAVALELDTIEDLDVIANLDLLEALLLLEEGTG